MNRPVDVTGEVRCCGFAWCPGNQRPYAPMPAVTPEERAAAQRFDAELAAMWLRRGAA